MADEEETEVLAAPVEEKTETVVEKTNVEEPKVDETKVEDKPVDWRASITDKDLKKHADRFTTIDDLVKANVESRQKLSKAIIPPGKDASPEDIASYRKAAGIPENEEGYVWPEAPEGVVLDDAVVEERAGWNKFFLENGFTKTQAEQAIQRAAEHDALKQQADVAADDAYAKASEAKLKVEWGTEYAVNLEYQNRALSAYFGNDLPEARHIQDKTGRYVLDNPVMVKAFARLGRELQDGDLGPPLTATERDSVGQQIKDVRKAADEAYNAGDKKLANQLSEQERQLIAKRDGGGNVVGTGGRTL